MITIRPGSHVHTLLSILPFVGEYPMSALRLLGSVRSYKDLIHKLTQVQEFRFPDSDERFTCRLLNVLCTTLNFDETFPGHITAVNLQHSDQVCLSKTLGFSYFADVFANPIILLNLLLHKVNPFLGLKLVHLGLFYEFVVIQWD